MNPVPEGLRLFAANAYACVESIDAHDLEYATELTDQNRTKHMTSESVQLCMEL